MKTAEGSVWEAAEAAAFHKIDNLVGITDVNRLGQSRATMWQHDMEAYASKWRAFGWHAIVVDGHDINALLDAYAEARTISGRPTMILARTFKGHGIPAIEDKDAWHGKPLKKGAEEDAAVAGARGAVPAGGSRCCTAGDRRNPEAGWCGHVARLTSRGAAAAL